MAVVVRVAALRVLVVVVSPTVVVVVKMTVIHTDGGEK
jgi:hypothetical protein